MFQNLFFRHSKPRFQFTNQLTDSSLLSRCRASLFEISDQTDPDPVLVELLLTGMGSTQLVSPAKCGLDFSVLHPVAITDEVMIPDAPPVAS